MGRSLKNRAPIWLPFPILFLLFLSSLSSADTVQQVWPELDTYVNLNSHTRLFFVAKLTREEQAGKSGEFGANIDFYLKPFWKLSRFAGFQLDESKSRPLLLRTGYEYLPSANGDSEQRVVLEATGRYPVKVGILFSNRNRVDLRWIENNPFSWRYRNRLTMEKNLVIHRLRMAPYARIEFYYDSQYSKWSTTATSAGSIFTWGRHVELEPYYEHQNNTGQPPNQQVNAIGFVCSLFF
jgi:hypothetical protein